jgi:predicted transposase/invertase (TIGR01784 family)
VLRRRGLYLLKNIHKFRDIPAVLQERIFRKAFQIAEVSNLNKEEMNAYDRRPGEADLRYRRDWKNAKDFAVKEASEKAAKEAAAKAKAEKQAIARALKSAGVSSAIVAQSTGLTIEKINAL